MDIARPHHSALWRLVVALILLGSTLGALDWWIEIERVDDKVIALADRRATTFAAEHLPDTSAFSQPHAVIQAAVIDHFKDTFPIVELYDASQHKAFEYVAPGKDFVEEALKRNRHKFPSTPKPIYQRLDIANDVYIQVLLPLQNNGQVYGYLEGVYDVPDEVVANIRSDVIRSVLMVWAAVILTGLVLYPLLMALNKNLVRASRKVLRGNLELLEVLGGAIAQRDSDTNSHNYRVTWYAIHLAEKIGLPNEETRRLIAGAFLHDVGKIGIPDSILLKPGKLTEDEFETMKRHVVIGSQIISKAHWLGDARDVVEYHHEKWDGSGYMRGLRGEEIPLSARIFAIVDVFDALTSRRPYKEPLSLEAALAIINKDAGSHFDPALVTTFNSIAGDTFQAVQGHSDSELEQLLATAIEGYYGISAAQGNSNPATVAASHSAV